MALLETLIIVDYESYVNFPRSNASQSENS